MNRRTIRLLIVFYGVLLSGCHSEPPSIEVPPEKDGPPSVPFDASDVPDATPKLEPRTIAGNKSPYEVNGVVYEVLDSSRGYREEGIASWYGKKFHQRKTANGEVYDMYAMTAAHKTLPIPSYVRVTRLDTGAAVVVRINDRGPFVADRIIDMSYGAARKLGFAENGTAKVRVETVGPGDLPSESGVEMLPLGTYLQVGAYSSADRAKQKATELRKITQYPVLVEETFVDGRTLYRVRIGPIPDVPSLQRLQADMAARGLGEGKLVYESAPA